MLKRRANEQTSLAEQCISVSMEQKLVAENSQDSSFRRLKQLYSHHGLSKGRMEENRSPNEGFENFTEDQYASIREVTSRNQ